LLTLAQLIASAPGGAALQLTARRAREERRRAFVRIGNLLLPPFEGDLEGLSPGSNLYARTRETTFRVVSFGRRIFDRVAAPERPPLFTGEATV
jgi:hypothetical protein